MQMSPYTPGEVAEEVYGREPILEGIRRDLAFMTIEPRFAGRIRVFAGPRGVGKTSLLRAAQADAERVGRLGFQTVFVTAGDGPLLLSLIDSLKEVSASWGSAVKDTFFKLLESAEVQLGPVSFGGEAGAAGAPAASQGRRLQRVLVAAGEEAQSRSHGLVILIDEIQSADPEGLKALAYAWQQMQSEYRDLPMAAYTAGLSHSQDVITDAVSFAERFKYQHLQNLSRQDAEQALRSPAAQKGVAWSEDALAAALELAGGYPFFIQVVGDETWQAAGHPGPGTLIEPKQVAGAISGFDDTRQSFFRARWQKATPAESQFLRAMAAHGEGPVRRGAIADEMGRSTNDISMARRSLLDKGLIDATSHGYLEFTAPGFAEFIREESSDSL